MISFGMLEINFILKMSKCIPLLMCNTIYYLIIVIYYFWYFYVKNVILSLGDLFPYFWVYLMLFRSNLIPDMVRYQLGVI